MSLLPNFLRFPPSRLLPLEQWRVLAHATIEMIATLGILAFIVTVFMTIRYLRRDKSFDVHHFLLVLPAIVAGVTTGVMFELRFEHLFGAEAIDVASVAIAVGLWTAIPQLILAVMIGWAWCRRQSLIRAFRLRGAPASEEDGLEPANGKGALRREAGYTGKAKGFPLRMLKW